MRIIILLVLMGLLLISCGSPGSGRAVEKPRLTVSVLPQRYFVRRIVGDRFDVDVMIPPGHSPHTYAPTPRQMQMLSRSKLYFRVGYISFELAWIKTIAANNPHLKVIDTSVGVDLIKSGPVDENPHTGHHHSGIDPHIWLSPRAVRIQAKHILDAVTILDPKNQASYHKNYLEFLRDIEALDREINVILGRSRGKAFMVFHPAWSYFAREYGLEQLPIEVEGKAPTVGEMKKIIDRAKRENLRVIFVQKQVDTHNARTVAAEIAGRVVLMDPLAEDWLDNMKRIAQSISAALLSSPLPKDGNENARKIIKRFDQTFTKVWLPAGPPEAAARITG
jgi:zinc transport system substrate-binding protein